METNECIEIENLLTEDFHNICRFCLKTENVQYPIFSTQLDGIEVKILFEFCLSLEINEKDLTPKNLCENCLIQLNDFYSFKKRCHENEIAFHKVIKNEKIVLQSSITEESFFENFIKEETQLCETQENENNFQEIIETKNTNSIKEGQLNCEHCPKSYATLRSLRQHWQKYPQHRSVDPIPEKVTKTKEKQLRSPKQIECPTCKEEFKTIDEKRAHQTKWGHKTRSRICSVCNKTCLSNVKLRQHLRTHTKEKPYQCEKCPKTFGNSSNLIRHRRVHTGEKPYLCDLCGKKFTRKTQLHLHSKLHLDQTYMPAADGRRRRNELNFMCEICGLAYSSQKILWAHMKRHSEPEYECKDCNKKFYTKHLLNSHSSVHSNARNFKCLDCGSRFKSGFNLKLHKLIHSNVKPHSCRFCGKKFRQWAHCDHHEQIHTGEKRYKCVHCDKLFRLKGNLIVHMRIHTGERPYPCSECGKRFYDTSSRKKHLATMH